MKKLVETEKVSAPVGRAMTLYGLRLLVKKTAHMPEDAVVYVDDHRKPEYVAVEHVRVVE